MNDIEMLLAEIEKGDVALSSVGEAVHEFSPAILGEVAPDSAPEIVIAEPPMAAQEIIAAKIAKVNPVSKIGVTRSTKKSQSKAARKAAKASRRINRS